MSEAASEIVRQVESLWPSARFALANAEALLNGPLSDVHVSDVCEALAAQFENDPDSKGPNWKECRRAAKRARFAEVPANKGDSVDWVREWLRAWCGSLGWEILRAQHSSSEVECEFIERWHRLLTERDRYMHLFGQTDPEIVAVRRDEYLDRRGAALARLTSAANSVSIVGKHTRDTSDKMARMIASERKRIGLAHLPQVERDSDLVGDCPF